MKTRIPKENRPLLSVGMIVKNEEENLERCLEALKPLLEAIPSELIVVDTGSTDATKAIAARYTDKVYDFAWCDDFSAARNASLDRARGEWFMFVDADEFLEDVGDMISFFQNPKERKKYGCGMYAIRNYADYEMSHYNDSYSPRVFRTGPEIRFHSAVHESVPMQPPVRKFQVFAHHFGYARRPGENGRKTSRNLPILMRMLENHPENPAHVCYQIGKEYISENEYASARKFHRMGIEQIPAGRYALRCGLYHDLASSYFFEEKWDETLQVTEEYFSGKTQEYATDIDMRYFNATAYTMKSDFGKAEFEFREYLRLMDLLEAEKLDETDRVVALLVYVQPKSYTLMRLNYADCLAQLGRVEEAFPILDAAIAGVPCYIPARPFEVEKNCVCAAKCWNRYKERYETLRQDEASCGLLRKQIGDLMNSDEEACAGIAAAFDAGGLDDWFAVLCRLRGGIAVDEETLSQVLASAPALPECTELIYYAMGCFVDIEPLVSRVDSDDLKEYLEFVESKPQLGHCVSEYFARLPEMATMRGLRWKVAMMEHLLLQADPRYWVSMRNFVSYCDSLKDYVTRLYGEQISQEALSVIPHGHRFGFYMKEAAREKEKGDVALYLQNLTKAGEAYPYLLHFIKHLINEQKMELERAGSAQDEAALLVMQVKDKIQELIFAGDLDNARTVLEQYAKLRPDDEDIEWLRVQLDNTANTVS